MMARLCAALVLALAATAARADDDNPFRTVKVGDYAVYKMTTVRDGKTYEATATRSVKAKDDKQVTIKMEVKADGTVLPSPPDEVIDLTKPYDPAKPAATAAADVKIEKLKEGTEKLKLAGKEYDCRWAELRVTGKLNGLDVKSDVKIWSSRDLPLNLVRMKSDSDVGGAKMSSTHELSESGHKD